ncbi:hypothetical protein D3C74_423650 [compost metagenome]
MSDANKEISIALYWERINFSGINVPMCTISGATMRAPNAVRAELDTTPLGNNPAQFSSKYPIRITSKEGIRALDQIETSSPIAKITSNTVAIYIG